MKITGRQLRDLVERVDDQHRDGMRTVREDLEELTFGETSKVLGHGRRSFLARAGVGGAALTLGNMVVPFSRLLPAAAAQELTDIDIAKFGASLELAAVAAYDAAVETGLVTDAAVGAAATTFRNHHEEHGAAFNGLLAANGEDEVGANQAILDAFGPQIAGAGDQTAILEVAYTLEEAAASTYLFALGALTIPEAYSAVATILPIESQHAVILGTVLDKPVEQRLPNFETQDNAVSPADFPVG